MWIVEHPDHNIDAQASPSKYSTRTRGLQVIFLPNNINTFRLFKEYKQKNVLMKSGFRSQIVLNFSTFNKIVPYSCLANELQFRLFGSIYTSTSSKLVNQPPLSPFEKIDGFEPDCDFLSEC